MALKVSDIGEKELINYILSKSKDIVADDYKEFEKSLNLMHRVFELKIKFNNKCNFNDFSYEIIS